MSKSLSIIEDDLRIRRTLRMYVEANSTFEVISEYDRVEFFLATKDKPEILLLDIGLPGMSGIEGLPKIKNKHPDLDIMMLTTYEENDIIFEALCAGACSYISKRTSMVKVVEALHIVSQGGSYMSPTIAKKVTGFFLKKPKQKVKLTERQTEIVKLIIDGLSYTQIAETCFISVNTVRTHIKKIYKLLEIGSKLDLMKKYLDGEI